MTARDQESLLNPDVSNKEIRPLGFDAGLAHSSTASRCQAQQLMAGVGAEDGGAAPGASAAADMEELWGADSDDDSDDGFGGGGGGDDSDDDGGFDMAAHEMRVMRSRMANLGFQSTIGYQYEDLLQHGFEGGMTAGLGEGRDVGYWVGVTAALQALPPGLRAAASLPEESLPVVAAAGERMQRLASERFEQTSAVLQQRAERFEASEGASEQHGGGEAASPLAVLEPGDESRVLAAWAPGADQAASSAAPAPPPAAQPLMLGLPHRVFIHSQSAGGLAEIDGAAGGGSAAAASATADDAAPGLEELVAASSAAAAAAAVAAARRPPRFVARGCCVGSFTSHPLVADASAAAEAVVAAGERRLTLLRRKEGEGAAGAAEGGVESGEGQGGRVWGQVYAVDDHWLAALDAMYSSASGASSAGGARSSVEITLGADDGDHSVVGSGVGRAAHTTIICQAWLLPQEAEAQPDATAA